MCSLLRDLAGVVGEPQLLTDPGLLAGYATDWTRRYRGTASCVVRPGSAAEVAEVVRCCARHSAAVVPQGGNTGLVGGSVPPPQGPAGEAGQGVMAGGVVLLSASRLTELGPVDALAGQVSAGAGVTIGTLRAHAATAGFEYGVDLASRESATVGGTIATNAGGIHGIRYGPTRAQLLRVAAAAVGCRAGRRGRTGRGSRDRRGSGAVRRAAGRGARHPGRRVLRGGGPRPGQGGDRNGAAARPRARRLPARRASGHGPGGRPAVRRRAAAGRGGRAGRPWPGSALGVPGADDGGDRRDRDPAQDGRGRADGSVA